MIINVTDSRNLNKLNSLLPKKDFFLWFYADWCGHCKTVEPEWKKLVKLCGNRYNLARVRDDQKDQLINNLGSSVQGFPTFGNAVIPTIKNSGNNSGNNSGYNNNNNNNNNNNTEIFNTYQGPRDSTNFFNFIKKHLVAEKVKRSMKRRGASPCAMRRNNNSPRAMKRRGASPCAMRRRANNSRKKIVFIKPKKGCGGKSKKFRAVNL
jgi:thiol-disulfide isomerase/thioredoxin